MAGNSKGVDYQGNGKLQAYPSRWSPPGGLY